MTAEPFDFHHRYTVAEFAALPEDTSARYELQEGSLVVSPRPSHAHAYAIKMLCRQIDDQLPGEWTTFPEIDVDMGLPGGVVRIPDVTIAPKDIVGRRGLTNADQVRLAVEVISPGSVRTDTKIKPLEYADAGIAHLWLIDPTAPVTATILTLVDGEYEESQRAEGVFSVTEPFPLTIDLGRLVG